MLNRLRTWAAENPMERPPTKALDTIDSIMRDMRDAEEAIQSLRKRLEEETRKLKDRVGSEQEMVDVATYIHWMFPEVSGAWLIDGIEGQTGSGSKLLHKWVKPIPTVCERCGATGKVQCRSRDDLHNLVGGIRHWRLVCTHCQKKRTEEAVAETERFYAQLSAEGQAKRAAQAAIEQARLAAEEKRLWELRRMPYAEYLQTPEWKERRTRHLESVGHRCQLCDASGPGLILHHRNYERRGKEQFFDLLVMCRHCHDLFHTGGS